MRIGTPAQVTKAAMNVCMREGQGSAITGINFADKNNPNSWEIAFKADATDAEKAAARAVLRTFDAVGKIAKEI